MCKLLIKVGGRQTGPKCGSTDKTNKLTTYFCLKKVNSKIRA